MTKVTSRRQDMHLDDSTSNRKILIELDRIQTETMAQQSQINIEEYLTTCKPKNANLRNIESSFDQLSELSEQLNKQKPIDQNEIMFSEQEARHSYHTFSLNAAATQDNIYYGNHQMDPDNSQHHMSFEGKQLV